MMRIGRTLPLASRTVPAARLVAPRELADLMEDLPLELLRRVVAAQLHQVMARGDLDEHREVASRSNRNRDERQRRPQNVLRALVDPQPLVGVPFLPGVQTDDQLHELALAYGRDAEQLLDVDDPQPADLHVVARQIHPGADEVVADLADLHQVVRDEPVAPHDEVESALALPDAAVTEQEHAEAVDVHEDAMQRGDRRQPLLEEAVEPLD